MEVLLKEKQVVYRVKDLVEMFSLLFKPSETLVSVEISYFLIVKFTAEKYYRWNMLMKM